MWHHFEQQKHNPTLHRHTAQLFCIGCPKNGMEQLWARVDKVPILSDKTRGLKALQCLGPEFTSKSALITQDCISTIIHIYG